jgi:competence protein ComEC
VIEAGDALEFTARFRLADTVYGEQTNAYFAKGIFLLAYADGDIAVTDAKTPAAYWPCARRTRRSSWRGASSGRCAGLHAALLLGDQSGVYTDRFYPRRFRPPARRTSSPSRECTCRFSSAF